MKNLSAAVSFPKTCAKQNFNKTTFLIEEANERFILSLNNKHTKT